MGYLTDKKLIIAQAIVKLKIKIKIVKKCSHSLLTTFRVKFRAIVLRTILLVLKKVLICSFVLICYLLYLHPEGIIFDSGTILNSLSFCHYVQHQAGLCVCSGYFQGDVIEANEYISTYKLSVCVTSSKSTPNDVQFAIHFLFISYDYFFNGLF